MAGPFCPIRAEDPAVVTARKIWDAQHPGPSLSLPRLRLPILRPLPDFKPLSPLPLVSVRPNPGNFVFKSLARPRAPAVASVVTIGAVGVVGLARLARGTRWAKTAPAAALGLAAVSLLAACGPVDSNEPCVSFNLTNQTRHENLVVWADGQNMGMAEPGQNKEIKITEGPSRIEVRESLSGDALRSEDVDAVCGQNLAWAVEDPLEAEMDIFNKTGGYVEVLVNGASFGLLPPGNFGLPVREGSRRLVIKDYEDGEIFYDATENFRRGSVSKYTATDPPCSDLEVYNGTLEDVSVLISGRSYGSLAPGAVVGYPINDDYHLIQVIGAGGKVYFDFRQYYGCGQIYYLDVY